MLSFVLLVTMVWEKSCCCCCFNIDCGVWWITWFGSCFALFVGSIGGEEEEERWTRACVRANCLGLVSTTSSFTISKQNKRTSVHKHSGGKNSAVEQDRK